MTQVTDTCPKCGVIHGEIVGDSVYYKCGTTAICNPDGSLSELQVRCKKEEPMVSDTEGLLRELRATRRTLQIRVPYDRPYHVSLHNPESGEIEAVGLNSHLNPALQECLDHFRRLT